MADIFLSYKRENEDRARQLRQALEEEGWSVWWDRTLLAGAPFKQEIVEEIQAARCVIPLWSSSAVESVWVKAETVQAWPRLVPVLLEKDLPIPEPFDSLHAIDLSTWNAGDPLPDDLLESITAKVPPQKLLTPRGKRLAELAHEATQLAADVERFQEAQLAELRVPPPPYLQPMRAQPGGSFHDMQMHLAFKERFGKRLLDLHDACAANHIHDHVFDSMFGGPTVGGQAIYTTINGLRALSKRLWPNADSQE